MGAKCPCSPSRDPQEPALPAGYPYLGTESSVCTPCTNTRPSLIKRTNQDVSNVVIIIPPAQEGSGTSFPAVHLQQCWQQLMVLCWAEGPQGRDCSTTKRFTPLITVHTPRALLQRLLRHCCHEAGTAKPDFSLLGFNQCCSATHSPLNLSAPAQFRHGRMQMSLVWTFPFSNYSGYCTAAFS